MSIIHAIPTPEQLAALKEYAELHGRTWKAQLLAEWDSADSCGPLRAVRNAFGPTWLLKKFKLPEDTPMTK